MQKILKDCWEVEQNLNNVAEVIQMGKYTKGRKRPIRITIWTEEKKKEIFKNIHKLRRSVDDITITPDLAVYQRELYEVMKEAKNEKNVINQKGLSTEFVVHHGDDM